MVCELMNNYQPRLKGLTMINTDNQGFANTVASATLRNGGYTSPAALKNTRYVIGCGNLAVIPLDGLEKTYNDIRFTLAELYDTYHPTYIGTWIDRETNLVYIDKISTTLSINAALVTAARQGEVAIWDNIEQQEIRLHNANDPTTALEYAQANDLYVYQCYEAKCLFTAKEDVHVWALSRTCSNKEWFSVESHKVIGHSAIDGSNVWSYVVKFYSVDKGCFETCIYVPNAKLA